jgi:hypothetical protein
MKNSDAWRCSSIDPSSASGLAKLTNGTVQQSQLETETGFVKLPGAGSDRKQ